MVVIDQMREKIPTTETEFLEGLQKCYEDAFYKAPEETIQWIRTQDVLEEHLPSPSEDWEWEVLEIFTTKSRSELEELFKNYKERNGSQN